MSWLHFCRAAGAQQSLPEPGGKSQVGEGSGALKPLAQGDSGVSYSPMDSCCIPGNSLGAGKLHSGAAGRARSSPVRCAQLCLEDQCRHHRVRARGAGPGEPHRQPRVGSSRGERGRIPPPAAPWRGRQRGSIISTVLLGGEGLVPGHLQLSSGSRGVSINWGKGIADKGGGGSDTDKGLFFPFISFFFNSLDNIIQHCKWIDQHSLIRLLEL